MRIKSIIFIIFIFIAIFSAHSAGVDFHLGIGFYTSWHNEVKDMPKLSYVNLPIGFGAFIGLGVKLGIVSFGADVVPTLKMGLSIEDIGSTAAMTASIMPRFYTKINPPGVPLTGLILIGYASTSANRYQRMDTFVLGFRLVIPVIFIEYGLHIDNEFSSIPLHEFAIGAALFK